MGRVAGAATLIAVLTIASRLAGFVRIVTFNWAVGPTELGDIYLAANTVPNIIFEIVAGGALASLVVPLLAGAIARGDRAAVGATTSALLTWALTLLVPLAVAVAVAAGPIMSALAGPDASAAEVAAGARMLRVFAPQLPLYGIGIVLTGVLQAHHRFGWPAVAPLLSSVTVMAAYLTFAAVLGRGADFGTAGRTGELILSVGTTLGVAVLTLCLLGPLSRLSVPLRPVFAFPAGVRRATLRLAAAGAVTVAAQQVALLVVLRTSLAGPDGSYVLFNLAQTIYLLPWAVLAVPVATAAYPGLAGDAATGDVDGYRRSLAGAVRAVLLLSFLGAAALVALARPGAALLVAVMPPGSAPAPAQLSDAIIGFAPGLVGYGLTAVLSRALYARGDTGAAALATVVGWGAVAVAAAGFAAAMPAERRVLALALANSVGMTLLGMLLLAMVARRAGGVRADGGARPRGGARPSGTRAGGGPLAGAGRAGAAGLLAAVAGAGAGLLAGRLVDAGDTPGAGAALVQGMLSGVATAAAFLAFAYLADRPDTRPIVDRIRHWAARQRRGTRRGTPR